MTERTDAELERIFIHGGLGNYSVAGDRKAHRALYNAGRASRDAEVEELRAELDFAIEEVEAWAAYAAPYFQSKHDLEGSLARLRAALARHADKEAGSE